MGWTEPELDALQAAIDRVRAGESIWPFERFLLWSSLGRFNYRAIDAKLAEVLG